MVGIIPCSSAGTPFVSPPRTAVQEESDGSLSSTVTVSSTAYVVLHDHRKNFENWRRELTTAPFGQSMKIAYSAQIRPHSKLREMYFNIQRNSDRLS